MKITTPKPPSFDRIARVRVPPSRRRYQRARKAAVFGSRMTWRAAKLGVRAGEGRAQLARRRAQLGKSRAQLARRRAQLGKKGAQLGQKRQAARPMAARASGLVTGATIMYFLDPHAGRRRRHVARDRMRKQLRRSGRQASQKARYAAGAAQGKMHEARSGGQAKPQPDDTTLARKVESEIFRDADTPKGTVNVNAEQGVVYLRGYTDSQEWIDRLIADARAVEGVREVRSLLHVAQTS